MIRILFISAMLCIVASSAEARGRHHAHHAARVILDPSCNVTMPCLPFESASTVRESQRVARGKYVANQLGFGGVADKRVAPRRHAFKRIRTDMLPSNDYYAARASKSVSAQVVSHPAGCPSRSFCGCGAAVRVFGRPVRDLWLAANWFKFPRTSWAPGVAGVRRHHVFVVEQVLGNGTVLAYDANSGHGRTQVHVISTAGYTPVNPHG